MEQIISLLEHWKRFTEEGGEENFTAFGQWLLTLNPKVETSPTYAEGFPEQCVTFGRDFGKMTGYAEAWERLAFRNLPIKGFSDFEILNQVFLNKKLTKNAIARNSTLEQSTIFETIKRLIKKGLVHEEIDANDRRVRLVSLTEEGVGLVNKVRILALKMSKLIIGDLTEQEVLQMSGLLKKLNQFHEHMHQTHSKEEIASMYDL